MTDSDWFEVQRFPNAVTMIREPHHREDVKSYLVEGDRDVAVLDTGLGPGDFKALISSLSSRRPRVLQTHAHWDHIGASHRFDDVAVHPGEAEGLRRGYPPDRYRAQFTPDLAEVGRLPETFDPANGILGTEPTSWLNHGDRIDLGSRELEVFHTPGHSPGGVAFLDRAARVLFVGDLLYFGLIYVFFPNSDPAAYRDSLQLVTALSEHADTVYAAHGPVPLVPEDVRAIRDAYEVVWSGRAPDRLGERFGFDVLVHDFGRFSFLLAPDAQLGAGRS